MRHGRVTTLACVLFVIACAAAYGGLLSHAYPGDAGTYAIYGRALVNDGRIPYRDFYVEYPPGAIPLFALPALIWDAHYILVFKLMMAACGVGIVVTASWLLRHLELSYVRLAPIVLAPPLMGPVFLNRYDPLPALLTSLALIALLRGRDRTAGAVLGVATAVKVYPAVWLPLLWRRARSRAGAGVAFVVACGLLTLPWFLLAPGGVGFSFWTQAKRHLQIESVGASILLVGSKLGIHHVQWIAGKPGSIDLGGRLPDAVALLSTLVSLALLVLVFRAYWRGPDTDRRLVTTAAAAIVAFTVFGKVLSPQYLTWLLPVVPLAAGRKGLAAGCTFFVALALTWPEYSYGDHGQRNQDWSIWLLLVRNGFLVATFFLLYGQLRERVKTA